MSLVATRAVVLRSHRSSESSKVVRLATRDLGVQSAIAKGALRPKSAFGGGLELLSEGTAQLYHRDTRELQTLAAFDVATFRRELADDVGRFAGATAVAEIMLKMAPAAPLPAAYDALVGALDLLATAPPVEADARTLRALWVVLGVLGFAPGLEACVRDNLPIDPASRDVVVFSTSEGGVLCPRCAAASPPGNGSRLPPDSYRDLLALTDPAATLPVLDGRHAAAHRGLAARFT